MADLKQTQPKEVELGGLHFFIRPFPAFRAANLTGELAAVLMPLLSALTPLVDLSGDSREGESEQGLLDIDIEKAAPGIGKAFEGISGDKIELLLKKLLMDCQHFFRQLF